MSSSVAAVLLSMAAMTAAPPQLFEAVEPHMGTLVSIKLYASSEAQARQAFRAAFDRIEQLDDALSDYKPQSELNRISRIALHEPARVSDDLFRVLTAAQDLAARSDGAFDITVGPVVRLWREARAQHQLPDPDALDAALSHCGYRKLHLDARNKTVLLNEEGMRLDAGGIAKGDAADEALRAIQRLGIRSALVAMSGDLAFGDPPPGRPGWKIAVDASGSVLELANAAVSTSGASEQYLDANGKRYSHILDPATGIALTNNLTVSVIAPHGIVADPLATAISVLGERRGRQLAAEYPAVTVYVRHSSTKATSATWSSPKPLRLPPAKHVNL